MQPGPVRLCAEDLAKCVSANLQGQPAEDTDRVHSARQLAQDQEDDHQLRQNTEDHRATHRDEHRDFQEAGRALELPPLVGNRKVVWEGRPVRGVPIPIGISIII